MKVQLTIQPGEGGDDAKDLVNEQLALYQRYAERHALTVSIASTSPA